jgi:hypothetical protein
MILLRKSSIVFAFGFLLIYIFITLVIGSYIESYEIFYASAVMGEFIEPIVNDFYTTSPQLFTLGFLSNIFHYFNLEINLFGWYLVLINFCSLLLLSVLIRNYFSINNIKCGIFPITVVLLLILDNTLNLSSTRIAMIGCFNILLISLCFNVIKNKTIIPLIVFYSILISLFRFEVVLVFCFLIIFYHLTIAKKNALLLLIPLIVSLSFMVFYNVYGVYKGSEANKIFYYYENQALFDNNNSPPNYYQLKEVGIENVEDENILKESLKFSSIFLFGIHDKSTFNMDYLKGINQEKKSIYQYLIGGFNLNSFLLTIENSVYHYIRVFPLLLFCLALCLIIFAPTKEYKKLLISIFYLLSPLLINFHIETPSRFLFPFYFVFVLFLYMQFNRGLNKFRLITIGVFIVYLVFNFNYINAARTEYIDQQKNYNNFYNELSHFSNQNELIVIDDDPQARMFSRSPFTSAQKNNIIFLNQFFVYKSYFDTWEKICNCDSYSLTSKINFIRENNLLFIYNKERFEFLKLYLNKNFNINIQECDKQKKISNDLYISKLS